MAVFVIINILVLLSLSISFSNIGIFSIGLIGLLLFIIVSKGVDKKVYKHLAVIFIVSIVALLLIYFGYIVKYGVPYIGGGSDDLKFEDGARMIINNGYYFPWQVSNVYMSGFSNSKGFLIFLSWIMRLSDLFGGYHTVCYRVLNVYFLMMLGVLVYKFFIHNYDYGIKRNLFVLYAVTIFPNSIFLSVHVFRDTLTTLLIFSAFYLWDEYLIRDKLLPNKITKYNETGKIIFSTDLNRVNLHLIKTLALTIILTYLAFSIRSQNLIFILIIITASVILKEKKSLSLKSLGAFFILALLIIILMNALGTWSSFFQYFDDYTAYRISKDYGLSSIIFTTNLFPFGIFLRISFALISPFPANILNIPNMFGDVVIFFNVIIAIGVIVQIYLLPYLFKNFKNIDKVFISYTILLLAISTTTYTFRHFIMLYPFMAILICRQLYFFSKYLINPATRIFKD